MTSQTIPSLSALRDSFGRPINYLRISLTEQCNFRCLYCMPPEGLPTLSTKNYLSTEEILRFVRVATGLGITRVRLTGGEPLLRPELPEIIAGLSQIDKLEDISITTNGFYLREKAAALKSAGLHRINLSLDSLDAQRFNSMTRSQGLGRVWQGIQEALALGFPLKLNVVVLKGFNDGEIIPFVELALNHEIAVRFLEFMPLCGSGWSSDLVMPVAEMRKAIAQHYQLTEEIRGDAPAQSFEVRDSQRRAWVGFIGPLSEPFCDSCSRMRLSADGYLQPCLFSQNRYAIGASLQNGDEEIALRIREAVWKKPRGSKYATIPSNGMTYLSAYQGREEDNPLIHNLGG